MLYCSVTPEKKQKLNTCESIFKEIRIKQLISINIALFKKTLFKTYNDLDTPLLWWAFFSFLND